MEAIFRVDGSKVEVSPQAAGPWDPHMQHGSAPAALCVWAAEAIQTPVEMRIARVTIDLMRPVPLVPLTLDTEVVRTGRKIQLCAVRLLVDGVVVVAASVLKIRRAALDFGDWSFLNADLTVSMAREPVGEWILLDAESWIGPEGAGLAMARLADEGGYFGRVVQSLVIEKR
jgi:Thioesterase-like superfamily